MFGVTQAIFRSEYVHVQICLSHLHLLYEYDFTYICLSIILSGTLPAHAIPTCDGSIGKRREAPSEHLGVMHVFFPNF